LAGQLLFDAESVLLCTRNREEAVTASSCTASTFRSVSLFAILAFSLAPFSCTRIESLVGAYELISSSWGSSASVIAGPSSFQGALLFQSDGTYTLSMQDGQGQEIRCQGSYKARGNRLTLSDFKDGKSLVVDYTYVRRVLTLTGVTANDPSAGSPQFTWTFKRR
jgi:hypothetical protein